MKIHPALFALLVLCALAGAFAIGRMGKVPTSAAKAPAPASAAPSRLVPTVPTQSAEIKSGTEMLRVEGSASILPAVPSP